MITQGPAWTASDGSLHKTLEAAQEASLTELFKATETTPGQAAAIAKHVLANAPHVLDILTTTKRSRPSRRLVNGYKSKRRAAGEAAAA